MYENKNQIVQFYDFLIKWLLKLYYLNHYIIQNNNKTKSTYFCIIILTLHIILSLKLRVQFYQIHLIIYSDHAKN